MMNAMMIWWDLLRSDTINCQVLSRTMIVLERILQLFQGMSRNESQPSSGWYIVSIFDRLKIEVLPLINRYNSGFFFVVFCCQCCRTWFKSIFCFFGRQRNCQNDILLIFIGSPKLRGLGLWRFNTSYSIKNNSFEKKLSHYSSLGK